MANRHAMLRAAGCRVLPWVVTALAVVLGSAGCASSQQPDQAPLMVGSLPSPNFDGPDLTDPAPTPLAIRPRVAMPDFFGAPRDWAPPGRSNNWQWIVIHHSATSTGGAGVFNKEHKAKGWDELGYHFVIGNGTDTRDGQVEVGPRWPRQKWGAHAKTADNRFNDFGIGICLVGNFDNTQPTADQLKSLSKLVAYLMKAHRIPADRIVGHGDTKATHCPGRMFNLAQLRQVSARMLADAGEEIPTPSGANATVAVQLLHDTNH